MHLFIQGCTRLIFFHIFPQPRDTVQLKDGEESEASGVTFTVELRVRMVRVNGAEQQRCTAPRSGGPWLAWRGMMSDMVDVTPVMWHKSILKVAVMALSSFFILYHHHSNVGFC